MKTVVIYDSVFGNTEKLAAFIADATGAALSRVTDDPAIHITGADVLLIGSPTRGFRPTPAVTAWLKKLPAGALRGVRAAAFDTRMYADDVSSALLRTMMRRFGYAATRIGSALRKKGAAVAAEPEGFFVADSEGPLKDGEAQRAANWARSLTAP